MKKHTIPEAFKEHIKHKKTEMPMPKPAGAPHMPSEEKFGRGAKDAPHHGRHKKGRGEGAY